MNTISDDRLAEVWAEITGDDLVERVFACPFCGERRMDMLVWDYESTLVSCPCGATYNPNA